MSDIREPQQLGDFVSHTTDEDGGGTDVGYHIGLGGRNSIWIGEISRREWDTFSDSEKSLGDDGGWWIILHTADGRKLLIGKSLAYPDVGEVMDEFIDALRTELDAATCTFEDEVASHQETPALYAALRAKVERMEVAAQKVVDETRRIHDGDPWPQKYRAPYGAIVELIDVLADPGPDNVGISASSAFDLGFAWRGMLVGQTLEDSRAVGRTLCSDLFNGLPINPDAVPSFATADAGIVAAKAEIKRAISRPDTIAAMHEETLLECMNAVYGVVAYSSKDTAMRKRCTDAIVALMNRAPTLQLAER